MELFLGISAVISTLAFIRSSSRPHNNQPEIIAAEEDAEGRPQNTAARTAIDAPPTHGNERAVPSTIGLNTPAPSTQRQLILAAEVRTENRIRAQAETPAAAEIIHGTPPPSARRPRLALGTPDGMLPVHTPLGLVAREIAPSLDPFVEALTPAQISHVFALCIVLLLLHLAELLVAIAIPVNAVGIIAFAARLGAVAAPLLAALAVVEVIDVRRVPIPTVDMRAWRRIVERALPASVLSLKAADVDGDAADANASRGSNDGHAEAHAAAASVAPITEPILSQKARPSDEGGSSSLRRNGEALLPLPVTVAQSNPRARALPSSLVSSAASSSTSAALSLGNATSAVLEIGDVAALTPRSGDNVGDHDPTPGSVMSMTRGLNPRTHTSNGVDHPQSAAVTAAPTAAAGLTATTVVDGLDGVARRVTFDHLDAEQQHSNGSAVADHLNGATADNKQEAARRAVCTAIDVSDRIINLTHPCDTASADNILSAAQRIAEHFADPAVVAAAAAAAAPPPTAAHSSSHAATAAAMVDAPQSFSIDSAVSELHAAIASTAAALPATASSHSPPVADARSSSESWTELLAAVLWRRARCANLSANSSRVPLDTYKAGLLLVKKSLAMVESDADAHKLAGILLARSAADTKEKIANGYAIKEHVTVCVVLYLCYVYATFILVCRRQCVVFLMHSH